MTSGQQMQAPGGSEPESVRVEVSGDPPEWSAFLDSRKDATIYHDPRWGRVIQSAYGNRPFYLTARNGDGSIGGVLLLVLQKSLLFGTHLCSLPWFDASGILADSQAALDALLAEARSLRETEKANHVELRQMHPLGDLPTRSDKVTLQLDLPADGEQLWDALKAKVRNQVRKPTKAGMTTETGSGELINEFCGVYERTMRDLGSPPHSRRFFQAVVDEFQEAVTVFVVRDGDTAVASGFLLTHGSLAQLPWAASDWRYRRDCPNMLLYWTMLEHSCRRGVGVFDFGRSTRDAGTYRFKKQWGAHEVPLHWQFLLPTGETLPEVRPDSGKYRFLSACWRKLPVRVARFLGPGLISKLS